MRGLSRKAELNRGRTYSRRRHCHCHTGPIQLADIRLAAEQANHDGNNQSDQEDETANVVEVHAPEAGGIPIVTDSTVTNHPANNTEGEACKHTHEGADAVGARPEEAQEEDRDQRWCKVRHDALSRQVQPLSAVREGGQPRQPTASRNHRGKSSDPDLEVCARTGVQEADDDVFGEDRRNTIEDTVQAGHHGEDHAYDHQPT
mmetsp:Transcript_174860/g.560665  ORF Transcript_174860/g.560665 Transcript_174860/m.560665 type:complete len:203 (-) Transcript_174860:1128-1736(-)